MPIKPLLKLAAQTGPGHQGADFDLDDAPVQQGCGRGALGDGIGQALDDGGLAHPGIAQQQRIVFLVRAKVRASERISRSREMAG